MTFSRMPPVSHLRVAWEVLLNKSFAVFCLKIGLPVMEKKIFEGFLPNVGVAPSWSCDPDAANKLWFSLSKKAPHNIWL